MPESFTARALVLRRPDGSIEPYAQLLDYQRAHPHRSSSWQNTVVRAVGLLWDYSIQAAHHATPRDLFRGFALAVLGGTIKEDGTDPIGLLWPSTPRSRAVGLVRAHRGVRRVVWRRARRDGADRPGNVAAHTRHCFSASTQMLVWQRLRRASMLQHIKAAPKTHRKSIVEHGRDPRGHDAEPVKFFPPQHAERLLWEGHKRPGIEREPNVFLRYNMRDMMIALLDGWGGLRRSEDCICGSTTWSTIPEPGRALVVLHHPAESKLRWHNPLTNRSEVLTRREVLHRAYGLRPRNEVKRGAYHAGWKGMDLDSDDRTCVFWIDDQAGALFWTLYLGYLRFVRPTIMEQRRKMGGRDHPFLFVSERITPRPNCPASRIRKRLTSVTIKPPWSGSALCTPREMALRPTGFGTCTARPWPSSPCPRRSSREVCIIEASCRRRPIQRPTSIRSIRRCAPLSRKSHSANSPASNSGNNTSAALLELRNFLSGGSVA